MQIEINGKNLTRGIGWALVALFWVTVATVLGLIFSAPGDSGAGMVLVAVMWMIGVTFPLPIVPIGVVVYGVRKERDIPLWRVILKWGTIATFLYLICLPLAFMAFR